MMFAPGEIRRSLTGAALIFRGRDTGLTYLDRSVDGFWRSFAVIFLVLPIHVLALFAISRTDGGENFGTAVGTSLPLLALDWVLFPAFLALAAKPMAIQGRYVSYVVARNWCAPIATAITTLPFLLQGAGWIPPEGGALLSLIALGVVLRFHYLIVRFGLNVPIGFAIGIVFADFLLSLLLAGVFRVPG